MKQKIANLTIVTPLKKAGNVIHQEPIHYDLYRQDDHFTLIPCLSEEERRIANLPEELRFIMQDDIPVSLRGKLDGNFHLIQEASQHLKRLPLLNGIHREETSEGTSQ